MQKENCESRNGPGFIYLTTDRLILRDHRTEDLTSHHLLLSDANAMRYLPDIKTQSLAASETNLAFSLSEIGHAERAHVFLRIEEKETGMHIGEIGYTVSDFTPMGKLADLGYFTHTHCWNKGFTTEAVRALLHFAFVQDGLYRMSAGCLLENAGSERVMQKCGFMKEAEFKQFTWHENKLKDRVVYRLLREEWLIAGQQNID